MASPQAGSEPVRAVKLASSGEFVPSKDQYSTLTIPSDHEIFRTGELSAVSVLVGMPLLITMFRPLLLRKTYKLKHAPNQYSAKTIDNFYENTTAGRLMMVCSAEDTRSLAFATPHGWQGRIGTMLVARADKAPLYPHHIKVMLDFIASVDCNEREQLKAAVEAQGGTMPDKDVLDMLTPAAFRRYYMERRDTWHLEDKGSEEALWAWEPAPFTDDTKLNSPRPFGSDEDKSDSGEEDFEAGRYLLEAGPIPPRTEPRGTLRLRRGLAALRLAEPKVEVVETKESVVPEGDAGNQTKAIPPHRRRAMAKTWASKEGPRLCAR
ncbi:hypothetical protein LTR85_011336 [Meristemomyces frigidus]|nr:hypothetical protein LTR85_011336 [Meristemomyces frigidus]